jgi:hypothetical protein
LEKKKKQEKHDKRAGNPAINVFLADDSYNPNQFNGEMETKLRYNQQIKSSEMEGRQRDAPLLGGKSEGRHREAPLLGGMQSSAFDKKDKKLSLIHI